jgi:hypothetical protein
MGEPVFKGPYDDLLQEYSDLYAGLTVLSQEHGIFTIDDYLTPEECDAKHSRFESRFCTRGCQWIPCRLDSLDGLPCVGSNGIPLGWSPSYHHKSHRNTEGCC